MINSALKVRQRLKTPLGILEALDAQPLQELRFCNSVRAVGAIGEVFVVLLTLGLVYRVDRYLHLRGSRYVSASNSTQNHSPGFKTMNPPAWLI